MSLANTPLLLSNKKVLKEDTVNYHNDRIPVREHKIKINWGLPESEEPSIPVKAFLGLLEE